MRPQPELQPHYLRAAVLGTGAVALVGAAALGTALYFLRPGGSDPNIEGRTGPTSTAADTATLETIANTATALPTGTQIPIDGGTATMAASPTANATYTPTVARDGEPDPLPEGVAYVRTGIVNGEEVDIKVYEFIPAGEEGKRVSPARGDDATYEIGKFTNKGPVLGVIIPNGEVYALTSGTVDEKWRSPPNNNYDRRVVTLIHVNEDPTPGEEKGGRLTYVGVGTLDPAIVEGKHISQGQYIGRFSPMNKGSPEGFTVVIVDKNGGTTIPFNIDKWVSGKISELVPLD